MTGITDFFDLMPDSVLIAEESGRDAFGKPLFGSSVSYNARIVHDNFDTRDKHGNIVQAKGTVWIGGTPTMLPIDQITLPDGSTPPILAVARFPDEDGTHHVRVTFG